MHAFIRQIASHASVVCLSEFKTPIWLFIDAANDEATLLISEFVPVFDELCKSHSNHARMYQFSVI